MPLGIRRLLIIKRPLNCRQRTRGSDPTLVPRMAMPPLGTGFNSLAPPVAESRSDPILQNERLSLFVQVQIDTKAANYDLFFF
jgi:hypothetical protein